MKSIDLVRGILPAMSPAAAFVYGMENGRVVLEAARNWLRDNPAYVLKYASMNLIGDKLLPCEYILTSQMLCDPLNMVYLYYFIQSHYLQLNSDTANE